MFLEFENTEFLSFKHLIKCNEFQSKQYKYIGTLQN